MKSRLSLSLSLSVSVSLSLSLSFRLNSEQDVLRPDGQSMSRALQRAQIGCTGCACQDMMTRTSDSPPPHKSRSINQLYSPVHFPDHSLRDASIINELMNTMQLPLNDDDDDNDDNNNNSDNNDKNSSLKTLSANTFLPNLRICLLLSK
jgi:hypothetical protein